MFKPLAALAFSALLLTSCSSGEEAALTSPSPDATGPAIPNCSTSAPPPPARGIGSSDSKPEIVVPEGDPPCELAIHDITEGDGDAAPAGSTVTINYVGVSWSTGEEFDSSWESQPATFPLMDLIKGWQVGIPGMKEGGRRRLVIPPSLAYGAQPPPGIAPNETLIFVIDLIEVAEG